jgi:hypothetical protein
MRISHRPPHGRKTSAPPLDPLVQRVLDRAAAAMRDAERSTTIEPCGDPTAGRSALDERARRRPKPEQPPWVDATRMSATLKPLIREYFRKRRSDDDDD